MAIGHERIEQYLAARKLGRRIFARPLSDYVPAVGLALGLALLAAALIRYDRQGYSHTMLYLWLAALAVLGVFFGARSLAVPRIARLDLAVPPALALLFAPLYLIGAYRWPVQVSSDEVAVMNVSQQYASWPQVDYFGVSNYFARPALLFVAWGKLGNALGGIDLFHMRLLEASFGVIGIAISYALFRQLMPRGWAICASCLLGLSHSYLMISRLAMRENTAVFAEVAALALLLWGLRHDNELASFAGGIVAGLGFYVYYPSRATFPIWVVFLVALAIFYRARFPLRTLLRLGVVAGLGFVLMAGPIHIAETKAPLSLTRPQRETLMIYPEGRLLQQQWVAAPTVWKGYWTNVRWGLGTFNNKIVDHAYIYKNYGHGFVDPLTGILLWLGVGFVGIQLFRRRAGPEALLLLGGFIVLWLSFAFVVNKAPNYTRLLVTLPFVAYLVTEAIRLLASRWRALRRASTVVVVALVGAIGVWNLAIAQDFMQEGKRTGDTIGDTGRYVSAHDGIPGIHFIMATDDGTWKYYDWGNYSGQERLKMFTPHDELVQDMVPPEELPRLAFSPPFALFMSRTLWQTNAAVLADRYPRGRVRNITPTGDHVVLEVPS